jgi:hypothetical protein
LSTTGATRIGCTGLLTELSGKGAQQLGMQAIGYLSIVANRHAFKCSYCCGTVVRRVFCWAHWRTGANGNNSCPGGLVRALTGSTTQGKTTKPAARRAGTCRHTCAPHHRCKAHVHVHVQVQVYVGFMPSAHSHPCSPSSCRPGGYKVLPDMNAVRITGCSTWRAHKPLLSTPQSQPQHNPPHRSHAQ